MKSTAAFTALLCTLMVHQAWGQAARAEWRLPPAGHAFTPAPGCETAQQPNQIYDTCADQMALLGQARVEALASKRPLMVVLGANWCPSCKSLNRVLKSSGGASELSGGVAAGRPLAERVQIVEIAISTLYQGRVQPVPSGQAVLRAMLADHPDVTLRGVPFLAVVDPTTGSTSVRNLDDLEGASGWSQAALAAAIEAAAIESRGGPKAASEPGWLARKWRRWFGG